MNVVRYTHVRLNVNRWELPLSQRLSPSAIFRFLLLYISGTTDPLQDVDPYPVHGQEMNT